MYLTPVIYNDSHHTGKRTRPRNMQVNHATDKYTWPL